MTEAEQQTKFGIQRLFVRNISFESPMAPDVFLSTWKPQIKIDLNTQHKALGDDRHEVILRLTVTATLEDKTAFLAEVEQGCIATVVGFADAQKSQMIGAYIPSMLFPYAREAIDNLVTRGSFPALMLAPVNFDALYQQRLQQQAAASTKAQDKPEA
jgi:preprotein translocase subunit SecB